MLASVQENPLPSAIDNQVAQCRRLAKVLVLSKDMLANARQGAWEEVSRLEAERKTDLEACFSQPVEVNDAPVVAEAIAALLHLNEEIMTLVTEARDDVSAAGRTLSKTRTAVSSYLDNR